MNIGIILFLIVNFAFLMFGYYALSTYLFFSSVCIRTKKTKKEASHNLEIPDAYEVICMSTSSENLQGYFAKGEKKELAILIHGWMDEASSRLEQARFYQDLGYGVFLPDLRGHGKSGGKYLGMGMTDGADIMAWVNYFRKTIGYDGKIVLDGVSTGAAAILQMDSDFVNENISVIIADSSYESLSQMLRKMIPISSNFLYSCSMFGINVWCKLFGKYDIKQSNVCASISKIKIPVLLIGGALDKIIPIETQHHLKESGQDNCSLWIQEKASHATAAKVDKEVYEASLKKFLCS